MWLIIYIALALIHIGIFYAWNPFNIWDDDEFEIKIIAMGIFFPVIWTTLISYWIIHLPIWIVDYFKYK